MINNIRRREPSSSQSYSQDKTVSDTKCVIPEISLLPFDQAQARECGYLKSGLTESIWVDSRSRGVCRSSCMRVQRKIRGDEVRETVTVTQQRSTPPDYELVTS